VKSVWIVLISIGLFGCAAISDYYVSKPEDMGRQHKVWSTGTVMLNLHDITLFLQPDNSITAADGGMFLLPIPLMEQRKEIIESYSKSTFLLKENASSVADVIEGDYFYIEILMKAKKDHFFFNPREVYLELEDRRYLQASKYLKPPRELARPHNCWGRLIRAFDDSWRFEKNEQSANQYFEIPSNEYVGFAIRFETPTPNPGTPFNIEIRGLKRLEEIVPIPKIRYRDKKPYRDYRTS